MHDLYFKSTEHERVFNYLIAYLPSSKLNSIYYISFCYLASSTYKKIIVKFFTEDGIDGLSLLEHIKPYSSTEKILIRLGLHLFNNYYESDQIDDIFPNLDIENKKVVLSALAFRY